MFATTSESCLSVGARPPSPLVPSNELVSQIGDLLEDLNLLFIDPMTFHGDFSLFARTVEASSGQPVRLQIPERGRWGQQMLLICLLLSTRFHQDLPHSYAICQPPSPNILAAASPRALIR